MVFFFFSSAFFLKAVSLFSCLFPPSLDVKYSFAYKGDSCACILPKSKEKKSKKKMNCEVLEATNYTSHFAILLCILNKGRGVWWHSKELTGPLHCLLVWAGSSLVWFGIFFLSLLPNFFPQKVVFPSTIHPLTKKLIYFHFFLCETGHAFSLAVKMIKMLECLEWMLVYGSCFQLPTNTATRWQR